MGITYSSVTAQIVMIMLIIPLVAMHVNWLVCDITQAAGIFIACCINTNISVAEFHDSFGKIFTDMRGRVNIYIFVCSNGDIILFLQRTEIANLCLTIIRNVVNCYSSIAYLYACGSIDSSSRQYQI